MTNPTSDPAPPPNTSLLGGIFRSWFLIYLVPVVLVFGVRQYLRQQAEEKRQREQEQQILHTLQNTDPAAMDPALRMLLGIDEGQPKNQKSAASKVAAEDRESAADSPETTPLEATPEEDSAPPMHDAPPSAEDAPTAEGNSE